MPESTDQVQNTETKNGGDAQKAKPEKAATNGEEKVVKLEELEDEREYSQEEYEAMMSLYEQTISDFVEGELVVGKVLDVTDKEVAVDIGFKSEGVIPIEEFKDPSSIKIGDDIEVYLDNVEDSEGQLVLSKKKADFMRQWEKVLQAARNDEVIEGTCIRRIKGGIVVDLMGVDAFLPGSQIDVKPVRDFDALIGRTMEFKIVKVNEHRKNIVVSHRVLIEESMKEQRQQILDNLEKGQILEGTVKNITDFGVFIDLGGVDGLLHINDLSWGRVSHPSEIVGLDEKIKVMVLDFNEAKDRISLGLKQLQPHPWDNVKEKYKVGDVVKGKVVNISDYGTFVELEKGVEGLIHISEMSWTQHIKHPSKIVSLGETIEAKILNIDYEARKISLGLKQLEPDPWEDIEAKYPVGSKQKGIVRNLTNFGAFVELEEGIDGLIHISDLSWTKKIRHPGEVVKRGEEVEVMVLNIDKENRRISLGYKQTVENPWELFEKEYKPKSETTGKIVRMIEKGVIVELPHEVDGFVPLSQLRKQDIRKPSEAYKVGDELKLVVLEFNKDNKKIILSEKLAYEESLKDAQPKLAVDDQEAIAEYEKEVGGDGDKDKKGKRKKARVEKKAEPEAAAAAEAKAESAEAPAPETAVETETAAEAETTPAAEAEAAAEAEQAEAKPEEGAEAVAAEAEAEKAKAEAASEEASSEEKAEAADDQDKKEDEDKK